MLFVSNCTYSQNKEKIYVLLDNNDFYRIIKKEDKATLEIPYYAHKESWSEKKSKNTDKNNDEIVKVETIPNNKFYKFYSIKKPINKSKIDKITTYSVIDVSRENKLVWKEYPYQMIFIEKIDCENYLFWHMKPEFNE